MSNKKNLPFGNGIKEELYFSEVQQALKKMYILFKFLSEDELQLHTEAYRLKIRKEALGDEPLDAEISPEIELEILMSENNTMKKKFKTSIKTMTNINNVIQFSGIFKQPNRFIEVMDEFFPNNKN